MKAYTKPQLKSQPIALGVFGDYGDDGGGDVPLLKIDPLRVANQGETNA